MEKTMEDWARSNGFVLGDPAEGHGISTILGGDLKGPDVEALRFPGEDHSSVWVKKNGVDLVFVTQPYHISFDTMRKMLTFCDYHGLEMSVHGNSWHNSGETLIIIVARKGKGVFFG